MASHIKPYRSFEAAKLECFPLPTLTVSVAGHAEVSWFQHEENGPAMLTLNVGGGVIHLHGTDHDLRDLIYELGLLADQALRAQHPSTGEKLIAAVRADLAREPIGG